MNINEWFEKIHAMTPAEKLATYKVDEVRFHNNCMIISWVGVTGFGQYTIELRRETEIDKDSGYEVTKSFTLHGDSEGMDLKTGEKIFLRYLLAQIADKVDLSEEIAREADWAERQKQKGESVNE